MTPSGKINVIYLASSGCVCQLETRWNCDRLSMVGAWRQRLAVTSTDFPSRQTLFPVFTLA